MPTTYLYWVPTKKAQKNTIHSHKIESKQMKKNKNKDKEL
jgi:hypothetical protein